MHYELLLAREKIIKLIRNRI